MIDINRGTVRAFLGSIYDDNANTLSFFRALLGRYDFSNQCNVFDDCSVSIDNRQRLAALLYEMADVLADRDSVVVEDEDDQA